MAQRKYNFVPNEFYHIYNRGTDKRVVFNGVDDYKRFQTLLYLLNTELPVNVRDELEAVGDPFIKEQHDPLVSIGAYCLMPNHFHILLTPHKEEGVSLFMQKLSTSYTMYFNKKNDRSGTLFEGKFKSQHVAEDRYLKYLFSYIHLNPIKLVQLDWKEKGIKNIKSASEYLRSYSYSSYLDVMGQVRKESVILNNEPFPVYFESIEEAQGEIRDWLSLPLGKT